MKSTSEGEGLKNLSCGIIAQALEDWRLLVGGGRLAGEKIHRPGDKERQLSALREFFQPGGGMDRLIETSGLELTGDAIRRGMGFQ